MLWAEIDEVERSRIESRTEAGRGSVCTLQRCDGKVPTEERNEGAPDCERLYDRRAEERVAISVRSLQIPAKTCQYTWISPTDHRSGRLT